MPINISGNTIYQSGTTYNGNYHKRIVKEDLKIYLDANISYSADDGSGYWYDLSGYGNHCDWNVQPTFATSSNGNYYNFTLSTHWGTIDNNDTLDFSREQTVIMLLYKTSAAARRNPWNQHYGGYGTWTDETSDYMNHFWGDAAADTTPYISIQNQGAGLTNWKWVGVTRDTKRGIAYFNGKRSTYSSTLSERVHSYGVLTTDTGDIKIGDGYAGNWYGRIAHVLAYTRALEPYEMAQNFQAIRTLYGIT
jgi:hypothetical protein